MQHTMQQLYDRAGVHLIYQGRRAEGSFKRAGVGGPGDVAWGCMYRAPDGGRCGVGYLIPDELYVPDMEGIAASMVLHSWPQLAAAMPADAAGFLLSLQTLHDRVEPRNWPAALFVLAKYYQLDPAPAVAAALRTRAMPVPSEQEIRAVRGHVTGNTEYSDGRFTHVQWLQFGDNFTPFMASAFDADAQAVGNPWKTSVDDGTLTLTLDDGSFADMMAEYKKMFTKNVVEEFAKAAKVVVPSKRWSSKVVVPVKGWSAEVTTGAKWLAGGWGAKPPPVKEPVLDLVL